MEPNEQASNEDGDWGLAVIQALHNADGEDDHKSLDIVSASGLHSGGRAGTAQMEAANLVIIQEAAASIQSGEATKEEFAAVMDKATARADNALRILAGPTFKAASTDELKRLIGELESQIQELKQGIARMKSYVTTHEASDLQEGLATVEESMSASFETQRKIAAEDAAEQARIGPPPFGSGKNIKILRQARKDLLEGTISPEVFSQTVGRVGKVLASAQEKLGQPEVDAALADAGRAEAEVVDQTKTGISKILHGIERMLNYVKSKDSADLNEGLQSVEESIKALTESTGTALNLAAANA
jgi:hypothetical protein